MLRNNYIYAHSRKDTGEVFYIGRGCNERYRVTAKRSSAWSSVVKEAGGFNIAFLSSGLTLTEAIIKENEILSFNLFNLCNIKGVESIKDIPNQIKDLLSYSPNSPSGLERISGKYKSKIAGWIGKNGYWYVTFEGKKYLNHRVIWFLKYGEIPEHYVVNHIDNNCKNNLISNLEAVTQRTNAQRSILHKNSDVGLRETAKKQPNGSVYLFAHVSYRDENFKNVNKLFSYSKYGKEQAWFLAREYRNNRLKELNNVGCSYLNII